MYKKFTEEDINMFSNKSVEKQALIYYKATNSLHESKYDKRKKLMKLQPSKVENKKTLNFIKNRRRDKMMLNT